MRTITIVAVLNGFVCSVGCQQVVFETREKLLSELKRYLEDPSGTEHSFIKSAVNRMDSPQVQERPLPCVLEAKSNFTATKVPCAVDRALSVVQDLRR